MRTLVTGATGLVGNNVVRLLLEQGDAVRVLTRTSSDPRPLEGLDVERVEGDVRDAAAVERAVAGVDRAIHAAAVVHIGWTGLETARAVNVEGTRHVAGAARRHGVRLVHVSTVDALGYRTRAEPADEETPPSNGVLYPYVVTKREAEQVVLDEVAQGLAATIVNPAFMLGPWDWKPSSGRMLLHVARQGPLVAPLGGNNYCDVRDVAAGILAAAGRGQVGRRYILGGESWNYLEAWRIMAEVTGRRRPLLPIGPGVMLVAGWAGDLWTRASGRETDVNSAATRAACLPRNFSSARAAAELGYRPRPLREAAAAAWEWFQQHGYVTWRRKPPQRAGGAREA
jgi:dihydroflavonol-4-reductase